MGWPHLSKSSLSNLVSKIQLLPGDLLVTRNCTDGSSCAKLLTPGGQSTLLLLQLGLLLLLQLARLSRWGWQHQSLLLLLLM